MGLSIWRLFRALPGPIGVEAFRNLLSWHVLEGLELLVPKPCKSAAPPQPVAPMSANGKTNGPGIQHAKDEHYGASRHENSQEHMPIASSEL